ncbi:putative FAD-binding PCMH-type domain-containing protein [Seiridium cardinale]
MLPKAQGDRADLVGQRMILYLQNHATMSSLFVLIGFVWAIWRCWRFTIYPKFHPDEPRELPYLIPMLVRRGLQAHGFSFFQRICPHIDGNDAENPNLLWALRGGANNFGVVTRVDFQTFTQGDLWGGQVIRPFETAEAQVTALAAFNDPEAYDEFASLITTFAYSGDEDLQFVVNNIEYTKPVENPPIFHSLTSMPALSSTQRITNMSELAAESAAGYPDGFRQATATLTIASSVEAINATVLAWIASIASVRAIPGILWSVSMDPLPPQLYAKYATANSLGLTNRKGRSLIILDMSIRWSDAEDDGAVEGAVAALITNIERDVGELGALDAFLYSNYAVQG